MMMKVMGPRNTAEEVRSTEDMRPEPGVGLIVSRHSGKAYFLDFLDGRCNAMEGELGVQNVCISFLLSSRKCQDGVIQE